jgi:hypothetical protein
VQPLDVLADDVEADPSPGQPGHLRGGREATAEDQVEDLLERFDLEVPSLYDPGDAERGWIEVENRRRQLERFPLVTISVGVASTATRRFGHYAEAVATATEMKSLAKQQPGSSWAADARVG